jgi:hypothetical protein
LAHEHSPSKELVHFGPRQEDPDRCSIGIGKGNGRVLGVVGRNSDLFEVVHIPLTRQSSSTAWAANGVPLISFLAFRAALADIERGVPASNSVEIARLSPRQRKELHEALSTIHLLSLILR